MSKIVLITGVSGGIGLSCAQHFKSKKFNVMGVDRNPAPEDCSIDEFTQVDLSNIDQIETFVANFLAKYDHLDAVINNAGMILFKSVEETTLSEYDYIQGVNVRAPFILSKLFLPLLKKSRGSIVNVSSIHAIATATNRSAYAASKSALLSLTRSMAVEFAPFKIRVNAVLPGSIHTQMVRDHIKMHTHEDKVDEFIANRGKSTLLGRIGEPIDVAQAIYYFADSSQSSFVTGQSFTVDGGRLAQYSLGV